MTLRRPTGVSDRPTVLKPPTVRSVIGSQRTNPYKEGRHCDPNACAWHSAKSTAPVGGQMSSNPDHAKETRLPPAVTFTSGAELLTRLGIVDSITREGIRYIADHHEAWPFGPDKPFPYGKAGKAVLMATDPFLDFFRTVYQQPHRTGGAP